MNNNKNILVLGGNGYIGSRLRQVLARSFNVDSVDICWFGTDSASVNSDYRDLTIESLSKYNVIVLLAGHSSVKSCIGDVRGPWINNVANFDNLVKKITKEQLLIYASSASVYGNNGPEGVYSEDSISFAPVNNYDLTKYVLDLHAQIAIERHYNIIGLRFGTVNGWSPILRTDVMINSMYQSAVTNGKIVITNKSIHRALLGIEDLCEAVIRCIERPCPGIYNLASFNTTVDEIAQSVSRKLGVWVEDRGVTDNVYDFALDCTKFKRTFGFTFTQTPDKIVDGLVDNFSLSVVGRRDDYINYE